MSPRTMSSDEAWSCADAERCSGLGRLGFGDAFPWSCQADRNEPVALSDLLELLVHLHIEGER